MEDKTRALRVYLWFTKLSIGSTENNRNRKIQRHGTSTKYSSKGTQQLFNVKQKKKTHIKSLGKLRFLFCIQVHEELPAGALVKITHGWWWTTAQVSCWCRESGNDKNLCRNQARIMGWLHLLPGSVGANPAAVLSTQGWIHLSSVQCWAELWTPLCKDFPSPLFLHGALLILFLIAALEKNFSWDGSEPKH